MNKIDTRFKCYLCGAMTGLSYEKMNEWRKTIKSFLIDEADIRDFKKILVINPVEFYNFENIRHKSEEEVMRYDLANVKSSDIVIVNIENLNNSIGSCIELYEAYKNDIPIIAFGNQEIYDDLHPWIKILITRVEKKMNAVAEYIGDFYMI